MNTTTPAAPIILVTTGHPTLHQHPGPDGEAIHPRLGRLLQPRHLSSVELTAEAGIPWACDNDCFQGLKRDAFVKMLDRVEGLPGCLFVTVPDVVGDAAATAEAFDEWAPDLERRGLPVALVAQDGLEDMPEWLAERLPRLAALFIGGSTEWKEGPAAAELARQAKAAGKWVHWGRVNTRRRFDLIVATGAADSFDGSKWARFRKTYLDGGLAWCAEALEAAKAALVPPRLVPIAGGSPEADGVAPSLLELLERRDERRAAARREFADRHAELRLLERFDDHRRMLGHDYGNGQREAELSRRRRDLEDIRKAAELGDGAVLGEPTTSELRAAFGRVGRQRVTRIIAENYRRETPATQRTLKAWTLVAAELELRADNPTRR